ncbi:MAG: sulfatase-like hydrolase/transferase [Spirochaetia bacterium]
MSKQKKPHIIIFNPDQWRGGVMGHLGDPAAVTPNLDALTGSGGVSFSNAFCQNPVCTPSRCSFMTGLYPHTRGHRTMFHMLHPEHGETNLLKRLREEGYFVFWAGKNDLVPGQDGWEGHCDIKFNPSEEDYKRWGHQPKAGLHHWTDWRGEPGSTSYYGMFPGKLDTGGDSLYFDSDWANLYGTLDFIRDYNGDQPLCVYLPLTYPHPPYGVEDPWFSMIDRSKVPSRIHHPDNWEGKPSILEGIFERQNLQGMSEEQWTELRAVYYGMCARLDHQFGMLTDTLKEKGIYDDSAVFLFSDHGDFTGDYGLIEKTQNTFEDVLSKVPLIVKPPKDTPVKPGVREALVELVDFPATVYDLAGIDPGYWHFGKSLVPLLAGQTESRRDAVFCEGGRLKGERAASEYQSLLDMEQPEETQYWPRLSLQTDLDGAYHTKAAMCRTEHYKYVKRFYEEDELYDLRKDPGERHNRIADPEYTEVLKELKERMLSWYMETCDAVSFEWDKRNFV